jgi:hypothetical protein
VTNHLPHSDATLLKLGSKWRNNVTNDYYMPSLVSAAIGGFVERIWMEVQLQVMQLVKGILNVHTLEKYEDAAIHNHVVVCNCCNRLTAWYRYHMDPFDKTIWGRIRDPIYVIFTVLNLVPYLGFQTVLYLIKLVAIETKDDFQCIQYIESFKGLQFVQSLFYVVRGVVSYLQCAGLEDNNTCSSDGPGVIPDDGFVCSNLNKIGGTNVCFIISAGEYLAKVVLVYVAFFLLSNSVSLGGKIFVDHRLEGAEIALFVPIDKAKKNKTGRREMKWSMFRHSSKRVKATILKYDVKTGMHKLVYKAERDRAKKLGMAKHPVHFKDLQREQFKMLKLPGVPKVRNMSVATTSEAFCVIL